MSPHPMFFVVASRSMIRSECSADEAHVFCPRFIQASDFVTQAPSTTRCPVKKMHLKGSMNALKFKPNTRWQASGTVALPSCATVLTSSPSKSVLLKPCIPNLLKAEKLRLVVVPSDLWWLFFYFSVASVTVLGSTLNKTSCCSIIASGLQASQFEIQ